MRRLLLAATLAFSAGIHAALTPEHLHEMPVLGALFIPAAILAAVAAAAVLLRPDDRRVLQGTVVLLVALTAGYLPFVTIHVPLVPGTPETLEPIALLCKAIELGGLLLGISLLGGHAPRRMPRLAPVATALTAGLGLVTPHAMAAAQDRVIAMQMNTFAPAQTVAVTGDQVVWRNDDVRVHDVAADDGSFDSGRLAPGATFSHTLAPGTHPYHCTIHRFMRGTIEVDPIALSGPERVRFGSNATLTGLAPSGAAEIVIEARSPDGSWQERTRVVPAADGAFRLSLPAEHVALRARLGDQHSPTIELRVSPQLALTRTRAGVTVVANPSQAGGRVVLERYDRLRFRWEMLRTARLDRSSRATFAVAGFGRRTYLRTELTGPVDGFAAAVSATLIAR